MIPYPAHLSEREVQAALHGCLRLLGYDARCEIPSSLRGSGCVEARRGGRFDIVVFCEGEARCIVETKRGARRPPIESRPPRHGLRQTARYAAANLPVFLARGLADVPDALRAVQSVAQVSKPSPGVSAGASVPYPTFFSEPEIQTILHGCLRLLRLDARCEVRDGLSDYRHESRFDIVIFIAGHAQCIIEMKRDRSVYSPEIESHILNREAAQSAKYDTIGLPVIYCRGLENIPETLCVLQSKTLPPERDIMQRFTETSQWDKPWFMELSPAWKCFWKYLNDKADLAGVWSVNRSLAEAQIGAPFDFTKIPSKLSARIVRLSDSAWLLPEWIGFQTHAARKLNPLCKPHLGMLRALEKHGLIYENGITRKGFPKASLTLKDKDKDKDKDKKRGSAETPKPEPDPVPLPSITQLRANLRKSQKAFKVRQPYWTKALVHLQALVDTENYNTWIATAVYLGHTPQTLFLAAPSDFNARWITRNYADRIRTVFSQSAGLDKPVSVSCLLAEIIQ